MLFEGAVTVLPLDAVAALAAEVVHEVHQA